MSTPTFNTTVVGEIINVSDIVIARVTSDNKENYKTCKPYILAPTASIARDTTTNTKPRYYSGKVYFVDSAEGETKLVFVIPGLNTERRAFLLGKAYDKQKGKAYDGGTPNAPYLAVGYSVERPDGVKEFVWYLKGKFAIPKQEGETKTDQINEKPLTLEYSAVTTIHEFQLATDKVGGAKCVEADTSDKAFTEASVWFDAVQKPPEVSTTTTGGTEG